MKRGITAIAVAAAFTVTSAYAETEGQPLNLAAVERPATGTGAERRAFGASERVEARLAYLKTALAITDLQQPQWQQFADVLRRHARDMDERRQQRLAQAQQQSASAATVSAIDRLERRQQQMAARYHRLGEVITAAKPLYAVLSPEQQQVADTLMNRRGHGHSRHHPHRAHQGA